MTKPLPSLTTLIQDTWHLYISTWNASIKFSIWILYFGLASFFVLVIPQLNVLLPLVQISTLIGMVWVGIRMIRAMLELEKGNTVTPNSTEMKEALNFIVPLSWIGFLQFCIIIGGLIALIIPGIYLSISFSFTNFFLIEKNTHGLAALQASRELIKGRWWATFGRLLVGAVVFGFSISLLSSIIMMFITVIIGTSHVAGLSSETLSGTAQAVTTLFQSIIQAATIPLILAYQVKLYRALSQTVETT